jgi:hypothetical protein
MARSLCEAFVAEAAEILLGHFARPLLQKLLKYCSVGSSEGHGFSHANSLPIRKAASAAEAMLDAPDKADLRG